MNKGGTVEVAGLQVSMVPARTTPPATGTPRAACPLYLGEPAGFVVELENGFRIYHAGDTAVFGDMALIRDLFRPDLAMLPIGGHFTMGPVGAALAVELLGVRHVLPIHCGHVPGPGRDAGAAAPRDRGARRDGGGHRLEARRHVWPDPRTCRDVAIRPPSTSLRACSSPRRRGSPGRTAGWCSRTRP